MKEEQSFIRFGYQKSAKAGKKILNSFILFRINSLYCQETLVITASEAMTAVVYYSTENLALILVLIKIVSVYVFGMKTSKGP